VDGAVEVRDLVEGVPRDEVEGEPDDADGNAEKADLLWSSDRTGTSDHNCQQDRDRDDQNGDQDHL
jgi:hypothetical protein